MLGGTQVRCNRSSGFLKACTFEWKMNRHKLMSCTGSFVQHSSVLTGGRLCR